jgi:transposase
MVLEHQHDYDSQWEAICSVAGKLGPTAETVRKWVRRAEIDGGVRSGVTTVEAERVRQLEREEVRELRRANEILKAASAFFARELDPQPPRWWRSSTPIGGAAPRGWCGESSPICRVGGGSAVRLQSGARS